MNKRALMKLTSRFHKLMILLTLLVFFTGCQPAAPISSSRLPETSGGSVSAPGSTGASGTAAESSGASSQPATKTQPTAWSEGDFPDGSVIGRRLLGTIGSLHPHQVRLSSEEELARYLYGSLFVMTVNSVSGEATAAPYHASAEIAAEDATHFLIKLRSGMTFSDGSSITADDYAAAMQSLLDPKQALDAGARFLTQLPILNGKSFFSGSLSSYAQVGFQAVDDLTLRLTLDQPMKIDEIQVRLTTPFLVHSSLDKGDGWKELICSGPYVIENYTPGAGLRLKRREDPALDPVHAAYFTQDYLVLRIYASRTQAMEAFRAGTLDLLPVSGANYKQLKNDPNLQIAPSSTVWGIYLNLTSEKSALLRDPDFRQTLYLGTDRTGIAVGLFGSYRSCSGFLGPISKVELNGRRTAFRKTAQGKKNVDQANVFDPNKAGTMAEAVIARSKPEELELLIPAGDEQMLAMGELLKSGWEQLFSGKLTIRITALPLQQLYDRLQKGEYDMGFGGMGQDPLDPWNSLAAFGSAYPGKLDRWMNQRFDDLLTASTGKGTADPALRLNQLAEMESLLLRDLPMLPLFVDDTAWLVSDRVELPAGEYVPGVGFGLDQAAFKK